MSGVATAIVGSAVVGGYVASKSADKQADAAGQASDAQVQANRENIEFQKEIFEQQREDNAPWREIGAESLRKLQAGINSGAYDPKSIKDPGSFRFDFNFEKDPGYEFRKQEGINALDASAAARGRLQSGAQNRAVTRYASDLASQEYNNAFNRQLNRQLTEYGTEVDTANRQFSRDAAVKGDRFNRLATLANVGQVANSADQQARQQMASSVGRSTMATGNALAQGAINQGNARASAYQGIGQSINQGAQNFLLYNALGTGG